MATLERIRSHGVLLIVVVGGALLAFIVGDFLNSGSTYFSESKANVAEINGDNVKVMDYMAAIDQLTEVYKIEFGESNINEEMTEQIRQSVWETTIRERVLNAETEAIGMEVSKQELFNLILGNNIHPLIRSRRVFYNPETGAFDPKILSQFISMLDSEESANIPADQLSAYKQYWKFWENTVRNSRLEEKYNMLLSKATVANSLEVKNSFEGSKTSVDVVYAMKPYFAIADSLVTVSDKEIEALYDKKKEQFKQEANCDLKYVAFPIKPSKEDFAVAEKWINDLKVEFSTTSDVADVTNSNSDVTYKGINLAKEDVEEDLRGFAFSGKTGDVVGPLFVDNTYKMARIVESGISLPDSVKLRHIFVAADSQTATQLLADSLEKAIRGGADFAVLARQHSRVEQTAAKGGEIGWVRETEIEKEVSEPAFKTGVNGIFQVKNMNGIQLFQVIARGANTSKVKLAVLERRVIASSRTQAAIFNQAKQFASENQTVEALEASAAKAGLQVLPAMNLNINANTIANVKNSRQVVRWAFKAEDNAVSDVFECDDQLIVAGISSLREKGYRDLIDVKTMLMAECRNDKKAELLQKEMAGKSMSQLQAENITIDTVSNVTFNTPYAGSIGNEPVLFALAPMAKVNELSTPKKGNMGVFVFTVVNKIESPAVFDDKAEKVLLTERAKNTVPYFSIEALKKAANIEDQRYLFF